MVGEIAGVVQKKQGESKYFFGTVGSDKIKNITFVPVIERSRKSHLNEEPRSHPDLDSDDGYQRPGSLYRMNKFKAFLKEKRNRIIPPVLLSGRGQWRFEQDSSDAAIGKLIIHEKAAIVDGQHRLGGFVSLYEEDGDVREVAFILIPDLSVEEEIKEFVDVNNTQIGVPKPLTAYLEDKPSAQVAWELNTKESPFEGRITRTAMQRQHLFALHSVAKQVNRLFSIGAVADLDVEEKVDFMSRLWGIVADQLPDEWSDIGTLDDEGTKGRKDFKYKLLELTGLIAWSYVGAHIFARSYSEETGMNWDNVRRLVGAVAGIDWKKEGEYRGLTGEVGGRKMGDEMIRMLPPEVSSAGEEL